MVSEFICMLPLSSTIISRLANSLNMMSLFMSPIGTSYFPRMAPNLSTISSGCIPACRLISGSCIISIVASVDSERGTSTPRSSFNCIWSSILETTANAAFWFPGPAGAIGPPACIFFQTLYSGFIFITPLILTYFFGADDIFTLVVFAFVAIVTTFLFIRFDEVQCDSSMRMMGWIISCLCCFFTAIVVMLGFYVRYYFIVF
mmetsp:Transcript_17795/g.38853  ORF Transcript_17795/g.38853 Transcript_17795/m.38853 type:complete len:203 (-) Transcript_17795:19-627(-)